MTEEERYKSVIETWKIADDQITHDLLSGLDELNNIYMMADSGARGSDAEVSLAQQQSVSRIINS